MVEYLNFAVTDFLLIRDEALNEIKTAVFNTMFVAVADHGINSSQAITRYAAVNESPI